MNFFYKYIEILKNINEEFMHYLETFNNRIIEEKIIKEELIKREHIPDENIVKVEKKSEKEF